MSNKLLKVLGIGALIAVLAATILGSAVFAAGPESGPGEGRDEQPPFGPMGGDFGGPRGGMNNFGPRSGGGFLASRDEVQAATAEALGMTVDELDEALADKTLAEVAKEKNVAMADVQQAVQSVREKALQQAVEDSDLTQDQADLLKEKMAGREPDQLKYDMLFDGLTRFRLRLRRCGPLWPDR